MDTDSLIRGLQGSIAPCVFISGTGLLLATMTNRLARSTDRIRSLCALIEKDKSKETVLKNQIDILYRRCEILQMAIATAVLSILFVSTVILLLFSTFILSLSLNLIIKLLFAAGLICLIISSIYLLVDVTLSLKSLRIEIENSLSQTS